MGGSGTYVATHEGGGEMSEKWPEVLFETPDAWGDTKFLDKETLLEAIRFLSGGLGWDVNASECREWVHQGNGEYRTLFSGNVMRFRKSTLNGEWEPDPESGEGA